MDDPLSKLLPQATIVLIACSIVISGLKDLYDDQIIEHGGQQTKAPLLACTEAEKLRGYVNLCLQRLVIFYTVFLPLTFLFEYVFPQGFDLAVLRRFFLPPLGSWEPGWKLNLETFNQILTFGHLWIAGTVALVVRRMTVVRNVEANERWLVGLLHRSRPKPTGSTASSTATPGPGDDGDRP